MVVSDFCKSIQSFQPFVDLRYRRKDMPCIGFIAPRPGLRARFEGQPEGLLDVELTRVRIEERRNANPIALA